MSGDERVEPSRVADRWNGIFRTLAAEPRRRIVRSLLEAPADRALSLPAAANSPAERRAPEDLVVELLHVHLPALADAGYVEWQRDPFVVERGPAFEEVAVVAEAVQSHADRFPQGLEAGWQRVEEAEGRSET